MGKGSGKTIGIVFGIIVVAIIGGIYAMNNSGTQFDVTNPLPTGNNQNTPSNNFQVYGNNLNFQTTVKDAQDKTITYGDDTEIDTVCWDPRGSLDTDNWTDLATLSEAETGDANINLDSGEVDANGNVLSTGTVEMYCEINNESGQDFFVDQAQIIKNNDRVDECIVVDATDDDDESWACRYDLVGITGGDPQPINEPLETMRIYLFDEDTDGTIIDAVATDFGSVATGSTITEISTHLDISSASADAVVISDIRLRTNETSATESDYSEDSEICFEDSEAEMVWFNSREPVGCISLTDISQSNVGDQSVGTKIYHASTIEYYANLGNTYMDGILVAVPKSAGLQVDIPVRWHSEFGSSGDGTCVELSFKYIDAFENKAPFDAKDIKVQAGGTGSSSCAIS